MSKRPPRAFAPGPTAAGGAHHAILAVNRSLWYMPSRPPRSSQAATGRVRASRWPMVPLVPDIDRGRTVAVAVARACTCARAAPNKTQRADADANVDFDCYTHQGSLPSDRGSPRLLAIALCTHSPPSGLHPQGAWHGPPGRIENATCFIGTCKHQNPHLAQPASDWQTLVHPLAPVPPPRACLRGGISMEAAHTSLYRAHAPRTGIARPIQMPVIRPPAKKHGAPMPPSKV